MSSYGVFVAGPFDPIRGLSSDAMDENLSGFDQSSLRSSVGLEKKIRQNGWGQKKTKENKTRSIWSNYSDLTRPQKMVVY